MSARDHAIALTRQGDTLRSVGRLPQALAAYDGALAAAPDDAVTHCKRGLTLKALSRFTEALASFERGIELQPQLAPAHMDLGNTLQDLARLPEALAAYDRAVALAPRYPDAWCNRGTVLHRLNRLAQAVASYEAALAIDPHHHGADLNRSTALADLGRHQEALAGFERAVTRDPDNALAHWNEALCRLRLGDFERGWPKFEWRWKYAELGLKERHTAQPRWQGDTALSGRTILVHAEQGLGDALQFCRYARLLAARGATVILQVPPALRALLAGLPGVQNVVADNDPVPDFDCHIPMLGLPRAFATTLDSIPANVPYLSADPERTAAWARRLGPKTTRPRVGLVWSGNPRHTNDHNRSIALKRFSALTAIGADFVALQPDIRESDRPDLDVARIRFFGDELHDFADTAALAMNLDQVISVDTSMAHLAGALGLPVWILLPFAPDWRWLRDRSDSPWYPTARLFRQQEPGDWDGVIESVRRDLGALFAY